MILEFSLIFFVINSAIGSSSIRQIHLVFRHGERYPTEIYPTDPYKEKYSNELGYLTKNGKLQMYNLGQKIREKYKDFIPEYYYPNDFKITSSYADRCLMSAQLFSSGLFPPKNEQIWNSELLWQPIPISYKPRNEDKIIAARKPCPKYEKMYEELLNSLKYKKIMEEYSELFEYLTNHTGMKIETIRHVEDLYNTLEIVQANEWSLPEWAEDVFPIPMKYVANISVKSFTETDFMKKIKGGPFLMNMLEKMNKSLIKETAPKMFVYSGHDMTIANILRTLNMVEYVKPNFAAYLIFELHSDGEIKIIYSNSGWEDDVELFMNKDVCSNPCTLGKFDIATKTMIPQNWEEECRL